MAVAADTLITSHSRGRDDGLVSAGYFVTIRGGSSLPVDSFSAGEVEVPVTSETTTGRSSAAGRRVIIADDHVVIRSGLARILERDVAATVVTTVGTGEEVMAAVLQHPADVLILDLGMPGGGIALVESVHAVRPALGILVYSMHAEREWAMRCISAGASGYVSKSADLSDLVAGFTKVAAGRRHISAEVAEQLLDRAIGVDEEAADRPHERLSSREFEVFIRLAAGAGTSEIADELGLSSKTISTYRSRILEKLGVERNADLTRYAIRNGLLEV